MVSKCWRTQSGITKWWYQLNTRTNECWMLNDCWAIIYNFNEQSRSITLLVKCKVVTLLGWVTLLLLRKHIMFIFISRCKVLPNLAEWWSYGLCVIFDNLAYEYFIHCPPVLDLCWVTQSLIRFLACIPWRLHTQGWCHWVRPICGPSLVPSPFWVRPLNGHIKPQKVRSELRGPDL